MRTTHMLIKWKQLVKFYFNEISIQMGICIGESMEVAGIEPASSWASR